MNRHRRRHQGRAVRANVMGNIITAGNANELARKLDAYGEEAAREKDVVTAESFFQSAEHYRRTANGTQHHP